MKVIEILISLAFVIAGCSQHSPQYANASDNPVDREGLSRVTKKENAMVEYELELLQQAAEEYDWKAIEAEVEPKFKEAAVDFRDQKHSSKCPRNDELDEDLQESFPFLDEMTETEVVASDRNPNGAGRKGQDFISYLKAFLLAPVLRVEQNSEAIAAAISGNPAFYVACGFTHHPASRTLRYFDQIMCEYGLWSLVNDWYIGEM